jgi:outer membrane murein-binding lipoprotein Lpp
MIISRTGRIAAAIATAALSGALLAGCSSVGEIVAQEAGNAACTIITPVIEQVAADVQTAVADIPVDPAAAEKNLQAAKVLLDTVASQIAEGAATTAADTASTSIDGLIEQAQALEAGETIDQRRVDELSSELQTALSTATGVC